MTETMGIIEYFGAIIDDARWIVSNAFRMI